MNATRAEAYTALMQTLRQRAAGVLHDREVARIRTAADDLLFANDRHAPAVLEAFADMSALLTDVMERGGWSEDRIDRVALTLELTAPPVCDVAPSIPPRGMCTVTA